jgi:hypothetical protein
MRVVVCAHHVADHPRGGGHFWVYLQYVHGLRALGCDAQWLEQFHGSGCPRRDRRALLLFFERMRRFGLDGRVLLYRRLDDGRIAWIGRSPGEAEAALRGADLLLNFHYALEPDVFARFRRTALVDIDPGLLQFWIRHDQLAVAEHDRHFTIGESAFEDGRRWIPTRPPVCLDLWPPVEAPPHAPFTTVSGWWGGPGEGEWITDGADVYYANNKRDAFLRLLELPERTRQPLELALCLDLRAAAPAPESASSVPGYRGDAHDRELLRRHGWRVRRAECVAGSPARYRRYVQGSRGELSAAKPGYVRTGSAWVSDRSVCYLASGKPVVVEHTGPSAYLPDGLGMFRFRDLAEAAAALECVVADYAKQSRAARELAAAHFDARAVLPRLLDAALG